MNEDFYKRMKNIYSVRAVKFRKLKLPIDSFNCWFWGLPEKPQDTDLIQYCLKIKDESLGLVAGNCYWYERIKYRNVKAFSDDVQHSISETKRYKRMRNVVLNNNISKCDELKKVQSKFIKKKKDCIDHFLNIGKTFGRVKICEIITNKRSNGTNKIFYKCKCTKCNFNFIRYSSDFLTKNNTCPNCQSTAKRQKAGTRLVDDKKNLYIFDEYGAKQFMSEYCQVVSQEWFYDAFIDSVLLGKRTDFLKYYF